MDLQIKQRSDDVGLKNNSASADNIKPAIKKRRT